MLLFDKPGCDDVTVYIGDCALKMSERCKVKGLLRINYKERYFLHFFLKWYAATQTVLVFINLEFKICLKPLQWRWMQFSL